MAKVRAAGQGKSAAHSSITSIQMAVAQDPAHNFALISVPGDYAAAEAMKALRLGMNVMVFSDNVSPDSELSLKAYARDHDLMVMGPDCGTAIVNGVPLGFANVVRRRPNWRCRRLGYRYPGSNGEGPSTRFWGITSSRYWWARPVSADRWHFDAPRAEFT